MEKAPGRSIKFSLGTLLVTGLMLWEIWRSGGRITDILPVAAAAMLHEGGHLAAARVSGVRVLGMHLDLLGARIRLDGLMAYGTEWLIAACGPLANLLSAAIALLVCRTADQGCREGVSLFIIASQALGGINLLPVESLDGGRMLYCALAPALGSHPAARFLRVTSTVCLAILWLLAGYILIRADGMLTVYIFSLCLLMRLLPRDD